MDTPNGAKTESPPTTENIDIDSEGDDEVDQLDSDEEAGSEAIKMGSAGTPYVHEVRVPGESLLPALRLENIIQADGA